MKAIIYYTLLTALRSRLFIGLSLLIIVAISIATFLGSTALVEKNLITIAYAASATRFCIIIGCIIFVCQHVQSAMDSKEIEFMITHPISRAQFIIGYWLSFVIFASIIVLPSSLIITILSYLLTNDMSLPHFGIWAASILAECIIVIAFALVSALILSSSVTATIATLAFYLLSRMISFFTYTQQSIEHHGMVGFLEDYILTPITILLPRLDFFAKSSWLIYPTETLPYYWCIQTVIYIPILLTMAIYDFQRKEF